jgi:hypothetical protein
MMTKHCLVSGHGRGRGLHLPQCFKAMVNVCTISLTLNESILPAQDICVFHMILTIKKDYLPKEVGSCHGDEECCFL